VLLSLARRPWNAATKTNGIVARLSCQLEDKFVDIPPPYKLHPSYAYGFLDSSGSQERADTQPARFTWLGGQLY
jgi:hypothetical protein